MKRILCMILAVVALALPLASCGRDMTPITDLSGYSKTEEKTDLVCFEIKDYGKFVIRLFPDTAPITVKNFKKLVAEDYYDGLIFHRIVSNFVIQTGDPTASGMGGSDDEIKGEFSENGVKNDLSHTHGVVSMARHGDDMDSASSQFFICLSDSYTDTLDGNYASFGYVVNGLDVVDRIGKAVVNSYTKRPLIDIQITSAYFITE